MQKQKYDRKVVFAWSMYDFANSAFTTLVVTFIYATYFTKVVAPDEIIGTTLWSRAVSLTAIAVAVLSPVMGAIADRGGYRKRFLFIMTVTAVLGSAMLSRVYPGQMMKALVWFVVGNIAFELGGVFYNAFLPDIAPKDKIGRVSGYGWSLGYIGGLAAMFIAMIGFINPAQPWMGQTQTSTVRAGQLPVWESSTIEEIAATTGYQVFEWDGERFEIRGVTMDDSGTITGVRVYNHDGMKTLSLDRIRKIKEETGLDLVDMALKSGNNIRATNILVAIWFALFSLPLFFWVKEDKSAMNPKGVSVIRSSYHQLINTFHEIRKYRQVMKFLLARLVYNDGLVTIFAFGGIYAAGTFHFTFKEIMIFGIVLNISAGIGAFALGFLDDYLGGKKTIQLSLVALMIAAIIAVFAPGKPLFWLAGVLVGLFAGPNQSASRSLMGRFVPPDKENEFFGFFAFSGKATAFLGPLLLGQLTDVFNSQRAGVAVVILFFILGGILLHLVDEKEGVRVAGRE